MVRSDERSQPQLTALLVIPNRRLAEAFTEAANVSRSIQVLVDLTSYPSQSTLEIRLRQSKPDIVIIDLTTDREAAFRTLRFAAIADSLLQLVGLGNDRDDDLLLKSLRMGASDFLYAPFDPHSLGTTLQRLRRLTGRPSEPRPPEGKVIAFSGAKPGVGTTQLTVQVAGAVSRALRQRVLLINLDLTAEVAAALVNHESSLRKTPNASSKLTSQLWAELITESNGCDLLSGAFFPGIGLLEASRMAEFLDVARGRYPWIFIDLPVVHHTKALLVLAHVDLGLVVSTPELPSVHLARKGLQLIQQIGMPPGRFQVIVNRTRKNDNVAQADLEHLFQCRVLAKCPNDFLGSDSCSALGNMLPDECDLGRTIALIAAIVLDSNPAQPLTRKPRLPS